MLHAYCVKSDDRFSAEYVPILRDMIARNLPEGFAGDFTCYTDDAGAAWDGVIVRPLAEVVEGAPGYFALNTVITGPLDDIETGGVRRVSYAEAVERIPEGASIVVFDTGILPHEIATGWVPMIWKIGGGSPASFIHELNVPQERIAENIRSAAARGARRFTQEEAHGGIVLICAGGPSLADEMRSLVAHVTAGAKVWAINGALGFLQDQGIFPDAHVMCDARPENLRFCPKDSHAERLYASQCDPAVLDAAGDNLTLWHGYFEGVEALTGEMDAPYIAGGSTTGMKAVCLAFMRGFRKIHLYGFDSSYKGDANHAYPQDLNDGERVIDAIVGGKKFRAAPWMIAQAEDFKNLAPAFAAHGAEIAVHGTGLLPTIAELMGAQERVLTAVYDLAVSPPTFEFLTFLHEAEIARINGGYSGLNIVFQPGPDGGFRADHLPPSRAMRETMLWKVCVPAARMLASVRNVSVLKARAPIAGDVFPPQWSVGNPVSHYGPSYCKNLRPFLAASDTAMAYVERKYPARFVTITLRHAKHWPARNSDMDAWLRVSRYLERNGIMAVFIPDEDGEAPDGAYNVCAEAFFDLDIRAALYEQAELCLGVSNGPTVLMAALNSKYLIFDKPDPSFRCDKQWLIDEHGFDENPQYSSHGRIVWGSGDSYDEMIHEIEAALSAETRKTA